ncbi:MAG: hypothetical protein EA396_03440 [Anaerolineaceae bacterium]|nr:MAG: hypothetical protein EA396_03440 [Anaerolineaceae bacterium]
MDRTVPQTGSEEIKLYMRTYYSLLRSSEAIQIRTLEESHMAMESPLHVKAREGQPDIAALTYSSLRLPPMMADVKQIVIGQIEQSFIDAGYKRIRKWQQVHAPGRRRRTHYNGKHTLAVFIASRSDIDDLVPILTAYQIEWNKLHKLLQSEVARLFLRQNQEREHPLSESEADLLAQILSITLSEVRRLQLIWAHDFFGTLHKIAADKKHLSLKSLASSAAAYRKATAYWWEEINEKALANGIKADGRPVYFVSSNTHAIPNLLTGFALRHKQALIEYIQAEGHETLMEEYTAIINEHKQTSLNNFLYYVLKKYLADNPQAEAQQADDEQKIGVYRVPNESGFQIAAQVIEVKKLRLDWMDERLCGDDHAAHLAHSDALIINIDYPLGLAAYEILNRITERIGSLQGMYVMGKAATLNGRVGDVMIPNLIHDEHSQNTYLFSNCFAAQDVAPYMAYGMVLDNQKAISVPGTFLQNTRYMGVFYREGYTDIEMEGGPYLSAVYEAFRPNRHPQDEIVDLHGVPFDIGFVHYASDTPMGRGHNLGSSNLSYTGVDPTYAATIAILRRILHQEARRVQAGESSTEVVTA